MSHINRAVVQVPAFFLIAGTIVVVNMIAQPEPVPKKNFRQSPPRIVVEHAPEGMGGGRGELQKFKIISAQLETAEQQTEESQESAENLN